MLQAAKKKARSYYRPTDPKWRQAGDSVQYPLIFLGVSQVEAGREILGYVLIAIGVVFKILTNFIKGQ